MNALSCRSNPHPRFDPSQKIQARFSVLRGGRSGSFACPHQTSEAEQVGPQLLGRGRVLLSPPPCPHPPSCHLGDLHSEPAREAAGRPEGHALPPRPHCFRPSPSLPHPDGGDSGRDKSPDLKKKLKIQVGAADTVGLVRIPGVPTDGRPGRKWSQQRHHLETGNRVFRVWFRGPGRVETISLYVPGASPPRRGSRWERGPGGGPGSSPAPAPRSLRVSSRRHGALGRPRTWRLKGPGPERSAPRSLQPLGRRG